jgi:hypothetical protein
MSWETKGSNWRITGADYLQQLDRPGFAWEFLRRNPAYQKDYKRIAREDASDASSEGRSRDALVWRWGLAFCGRSPAFRRSSDCFLAHKRTAHRGASRARADEFRRRAPN